MEVRCEKLKKKAKINMQRASKHQSIKAHKGKGGQGQDHRRSQGQREGELKKKKKRGEQSKGNRQRQGRERGPSHACTLCSERGTDRARRKRGC